jgi:hypothetical protein
MPSMKQKSWNRRSLDRVSTMPCQILLLVLSMGSIAQAQPAPEITLDRLFRYDASSSGLNIQYQRVLDSFKNWMGSYQRIRKDNDRSFIVVFDRGSLPLDAKFKTNGSIDSLNFGCPISRSLSLNDAPMDLRKQLSKCTGFKSGM